MGRHHRKQSKRSGAAPSMMMLQMMMMPQGAPSRESTSSDSEQDKAPQVDPRSAELNDGVAIPPPGERKPITRSATTLKQLGRVNLANLVFLLDKSFDGGYTALLTVTGLLALLFALTRLRPTSNLRDLCFLHHHLLSCNHVCLFCCILLSVCFGNNVTCNLWISSSTSNHYPLQVVL